MSARSIAVGKALEALEAAVLDLIRMPHLACGRAEHWIGRPQEPQLSAPVAGALLFGSYGIDVRIRQLGGRFRHGYQAAAIALDARRAGEIRCLIAQNASQNSAWEASWDAGALEIQAESLILLVSGEGIEPSTT